MYFLYVCRLQQNTVGGQSDRELFFSNILTTSHTDIVESNQGFKKHLDEPQLTKFCDLFNTSILSTKHALIFALRLHKMTFDILVTPLIVISVCHS